MSCPYLIKKDDFSYKCHYSFKKLGLFKALFFCSTSLCLHNCEASALSEEKSDPEPRKKIEYSKESSKEYSRRTEAAVL